MSLCHFPSACLPQKFVSILFMFFNIYKISPVEKDYVKLHYKRLLGDILGFAGYSLYHRYSVLPRSRVLGKNMSFSYIAGNQAGFQHITSTHQTLPSSMLLLSRIFIYIFHDTKQLLILLQYISLKGLT